MAGCFFLLLHALFMDAPARPEPAFEHTERCVDLFPAELLADDVHCFPKMRCVIHSMEPVKLQTFFRDAKLHLSGRIRENRPV